jgi:hypothetical protein
MKQSCTVPEASGFLNGLGQEIPAAAFGNDPEPRELDFLSEEDRRHYQTLIVNLRRAIYPAAR